jgi:hypothetical protein
VARGRAARSADLLLAVRVLVVAIAAPVLARLSLERLQRVLEPRRSSVRRSAPTRTVDEVGRIVAGVMRRASPLVRPGCMPRGFTRYYALRQSGFDAALCFGMGRPTGGPTGELSGHCWLVLDGAPVFEPLDELAAFHEIARVSAAGVAGAAGHVPSGIDR